MNKLYFKSEIFNVFEIARILFNNYYNGKDDYSDIDIKAINNMLLSIEHNIKNIKEEIKYYELEKENK